MSTMEASLRLGVILAVRLEPLRLLEVLRLLEWRLGEDERRPKDMRPLRPNELLADPSVDDAVDWSPAFVDAVDWSPAFVDC